MTTPSRNNAPRRNYNKLLLPATVLLGLGSTACTGTAAEVPEPKSASVENCTDEVLVNGNEVINSEDVTYAGLEGMYHEVPENVYDAVHNVPEFMTHVGEVYKVCDTVTTVEGEIPSHDIEVTPVETEEAK
jgi:hypothetical protein